MVKGIGKLSKIKWEKSHKNRLSTDPIEDSNQAKRYFDSLLDDRSPIGFLQAIEQNPYELLYISQIQVIINIMVIMILNNGLTKRHISILA